MKHQYRFIGAKMNKDADERLIPDGQYIDANNLRLISGEGNDAGVFKKFKGTTLLETLANGLNPDFSAVLGFKHYKGFIYVFGLNSTSGNTELWQYELATDTATLLFDKALGNQATDAPFNIDIVDDENVEGSERLLMYFNDRRNEPQKVNILKLRSSSTYYVNLSDQLVTKPSSLFPPIIAGGTSGTVNNIKDKNFQFAYRWIYEDGEISPLTPFSGTDIEKIDYDYDNGLIFATFHYDSGATTIYYKFTTDGGATFSNNQLISTAVLSSTFYKNSISRKLEPSGTGLFGGWLYFEAGGHYAMFGYGDESTVPDSNDYIFTQPANQSWLGVKVTLDGENSYIYGDQNDGTIYPLVIKKYGDEISTLFYGLDHSIGSNQIGWSLATPSSGGDIYLSTYHNARNTDGLLIKIYSDGTAPAVALTISGTLYSSAVGMSGDGKFICATGFDYSSGSSRSLIIIYTSDDYGVTFKEKYKYQTKYTVTAGDGSTAEQVYVSDDGRHVYILYSIIVATGGRENVFLRSDDFGNSFTQMTGTGLGYNASYSTIYSFSASTFGDKLVYTYGGNIYTSSDFGESFSILSAISNSIGALSPIPELIKGRDYIESNYNFIDVTVQTGSKHVTNIEIYAKERENGNFFRIKEYDKERDVISDNTTQTFRFKNDGIYQVLSTDQQSRYFDNIPLTSNSQAIVDKRLMYANYVDGRSLVYSDGTKVAEDCTVAINESAYATDNYKTLKSGTLQSYGILYKDAGGRPASILPIGEEPVPYWYEDSTKQVFLASVSISHYAPEWASTYSIVRKKPLFDYDVIYRFEKAEVRSGRIYLLLPSDVNAEVGYILSYAGDGTSFSSVSESFQVVEVIDNSSQSLRLNLDEGKWIGINNPDTNGFTINNIVNGSSEYLSGCFYVQKTFETEGDIVYYETPYVFSITYDAVNDVYLHGGTITQAFGGSATVTMSDDYDTIIKEFPYREEYKYSPLVAISTLGRGWLESDDTEEVRRYSSIAWSDVYVFDNNYNGLSNFNPLSVKALPTKYGAINHIHYYYSNLLALQDDIVSIVPVDKNILTTATGTGDVTQSTNILGVFNPITSIFGCQSPESFSFWGNTVLFIDKKRGAVLTLQGDRMDVVSNNSMSEYFRNLLKSETGLTYSCYNPEIKSFLIGLPSVAKTIAYRPDSGFTGFMDFILKPCDNDGYNLYSANLNDIYSHDTNNTLNLFYGAQKDADITFSANQGGSAIKVFEAMLLESTDEWYVNLTNSSQSTFIPTANFEDREGYKFAYIPMADSTAEADETLATNGVGIFASISGTEITMSNTFPIQSVSVNDDLWHINGGTNYFIGTVTNVSHTDKKITVSSVLSVPTLGDFIYSRKSNYIDGNKIRDYYAKVKLTHSGSSNVELYAVGIEVKESKN